MESKNRIGRGANTDFLGLTSEDGFVVITGKREGQRGYTWLATCSKPGCLCSGTVLTHEYLVAGNPVKCGSSGHASASAEPVPRSESRASVEQRRKQEVVMSPRQRMEAAARAEELKALEGAE